MGASQGTGESFRRFSRLRKIWKSIARLDSPSSTLPGDGMLFRWWGNEDELRRWWGGDSAGSFDITFGPLLKENCWVEAGQGVVCAEAAL